MRKKSVKQIIIKKLCVIYVCVYVCTQTNVHLDIYTHAYNIYLHKWWHWTLKDCELQFSDECAILKKNSWKIYTEYFMRKI